MEKNAAKNALRSKQEKRVFTVRNSTQKGFAGACKTGFDLGESPYVCFINSDCVIKDAGWLRSMGETLLELKSKGVKMVAPTTNNPVGGDPSQKGEIFVADGEDTIIADDSYLSLYCFMCHRQLFPNIGGFLKEYPYGFFEDQEIAMRMRKHGYLQAVCKKAWVHHEGEATIKSLWKSDPKIKEIMEENNRNQCIEDLKKL